MTPVHKQDPVPQGTRSAPWRCPLHQCLPGGGCWHESSEPRAVRVCRHGGTVGRRTLDSHETGTCRLQSWRQLVGWRLSRASVATCTRGKGASHRLLRGLAKWRPFCKESPTTCHLPLPGASPWARGVSKPAESVAEWLLAAEGDLCRTTRQGRLWWGVQMTTNCVWSFWERTTGRMGVSSCLMRLTNGGRFRNASRTLQGRWWRARKAFYGFGVPRFLAHQLPILSSNMLGPLLPEMEFRQGAGPGLLARSWQFTAQTGRLGCVMCQQSPFCTPSKQSTSPPKRVPEVGVYGRPRLARDSARKAYAFAEINEEHAEASSPGPRLFINQLWLDRRREVAPQLRDLLHDRALLGKPLPRSILDELDRVLKIFKQKLVTQLVSCRTRTGREVQEPTAVAADFHTWSGEEVFSKGCCCSCRRVVFRSVCSSGSSK